MFKQVFKKMLRGFGYEIQQIQPFEQPLAKRLSKCLLTPDPSPDPIEPVWPLPRKGNDWSNEEIQKRFDAFELWHYAYAFEGGLEFSARHHNAPQSADAPKRPLQRFKHFMPYLLAANGGSLKGKRVLDIACNSGFWSLQCAMLGAEVVGFDARDELVAQANLLKSIVGLDNVNFQVLDFWKMTPEALGGQFDIVLNLGILYHLPNPQEVLATTMAMSRKHIVLDTGVMRSELPIVRYQWEEPDDIRNAAEAGVVVYPSLTAVDLMLLHLDANSWIRIPVRSSDIPHVYKGGFRASWLIDV